MAPKKKNPKKKIIKVPVDCVFCNDSLTPSYKDSETLASFLTDRAKIISKDRTGVCSKHQRAISREIKRARHLALLPFSPSI